MKEALLKQATHNLRTFEKQDWRIKFAIKQLEKMEKDAAGLGDLVNSPTFQNIVNILGPYATYYKIDQVLKLLKEMGSKVNPYSFKPDYK